MDDGMESGRSGVKRRKVLQGDGQKLPIFKLLRSPQRAFGADGKRLFLEIDGRFEPAFNKRNRLPTQPGLRLAPVGRRLQPPPHVNGNGAPLFTVRIAKLLVMSCTMVSACSLRTNCS